MALSKEEKEQAIKERRKHERDTGSVEVQVSLLDRRIQQLADHLKAHPKDHHSRRGLLMMIGKRRRMKKYLDNNG